MVSLVVVSYDRPDYLRVTVDSLIRVTAFDDAFEVLVVDNRSDHTGETSEYIKSIGASNVRGIYIPENAYWAKAVNVGISSARGNLVCLLNDDLEFTDPLWLISVKDLLKDRIASVAPITLLRDGSVYCSGGFKGSSHHQDVIAKPRVTEWNNGAVFLTSKEMLAQVGLFNVSGQYPHYGADREWCLQANILGYQQMVAPVTVNHFHGESGRPKHINP